MMPAVLANAARIASASYISITKTTPAEEARYGYRMMKRGKQATNHDSLFASFFQSATGRTRRGELLAPCPPFIRNPHSEIRNAQGHSLNIQGSEEPAATRRNRVTDMKEKLAKFAEKGSEAYSRLGLAG